ncbi:rhomboid family intramembrane serine protease [Acidothermaceae bacterium B102]|nr:rhomboid family intramembrane serine protease [Acidothermaceae bacterium B102]
MNDAPVGFQCPECVKEGRASRPRTITGARVVSQQGVVSYTLVVANVLVALLHGWGDAYRSNWALWPYGVDHGEYYRLFTAGFVHFGFLHIALNMFVLATVGPQLEGMLGRVRFGALYLVSLAGSSALSYLLLPIGTVAGGASGAIFGLMGGLFVVAKRMNLDTRQLNGWILYSLVFSFLPGLNVDWRGHVGGLVTGAAVTWGLVHAPRKHRAWIQAGAVVAGLAVAIAVIAIRTATFPTLTG